MKIVKFAFILSILTVPAYAAFLDTDASKTVTAEKIEYDTKSKSLKASGHTEISNSTGQKITLNDSYLSGSGTDVSGRNIEIWLGENTYILANDINKTGTKTTATDAMFTACYECDTYGNAWEFSTNEMTHDTDTHMMDFYSSWFWVYDVPVMWFPFISMPDPSVKHKSGLLIPDIRSTNNMGTQINIPLYLFLADNHDATITTSYLTAENPLFQLEHRLNLQHSEFRTKGSYTHNLDGEDRWSIFNNDVIEMGENVRTKIYWQRVSDKTYLQKYGFYEDQPYLDSGARVEIFGESGYIVSDAHIFQELRTDTSGSYTSPSGNILPNIRGIYQTKPLFGETYAAFNADMLGISGETTSSQRMMGKSEIVSPWTIWGGNRITAAASARYDIYNFDNTIMTDYSEYTGVKTRLLPSGYLQWSLPLVNPGNDFTQIIEPKARITTMRQIDDAVFALNNDSAGALLSDATLFSDNRFSGLDLWENGTFADYGMRYGLFDKDGQNLELFLGQTYDFTKREQTDPNSGFHNGASDYVGRVGYATSKWFELSTRFRFSEDDISLRHLETGARVGSARNYLTAGHIWATQFIDAETLDKNIDELTTGAGVQLSDRFSIKFNSIYNITENYFQRHTGGIYYNHPCYFLALEYRRDNAIKEDYVGNTTIRFNFGININGTKF